MTGLTLPNLNLLAVYLIIWSSIGYSTCQRFYSHSPVLRHYYTYMHEILVVFFFSNDLIYNLLYHCKLFGEASYFYSLFTTTKHRILTTKHRIGSHARSQQFSPYLGLLCNSCYCSDHSLSSASICMFSNYPNRIFVYRFLLPHFLLHYQLIPLFYIHSKIEEKKQTEGHFTLQPINFFCLS